MPFEPLNTDEKLEGPMRKAPKSDFERQLMSGCLTIVLSCFLVYGITVWPWFVFEVHTVKGLIRALAFGAGTATLLGIFATLRFGLAGAAGFLGGGFAGAVFMFLRLQQVILAKGHNDLPQPEYPDRWEHLIPISFVLLSIAVVAIFIPKEQEDHPASPEESQQ